MLVVLGGMRLFATGGTDVAILGIFWPETLPADLDERLQQAELKPLCDELRDRQLIVALPCDADGHYSLRMFIDDPLPAELEKYSREVQWIRKVEVAGTGWFGGLEYLFKIDRSELDRHPGGCSLLEIPAGTFEATIFTTDLPDEVYETWLLEKSSLAAMRIWNVQSWFAATGIVAMMFFVGCLFFGTREVMLVALAIATILSLIALLLSRTSAYRLVQQARQEYDAMYPDYVVRMARIGRAG